MNNKLEVIGIDHGWSMMKTVTQVFVTGVKEITTTPALFGDVLEYDGKLILSILVDTFISKISFPMQPGPEIGSISDA